MKTAVLTFAFSFFALSVCVSSSTARPWYAGKTLQGAYVGQWKMATYTHKLATAAAWISFQPKLKDKALYSKMIQGVRPQAFQLVQCVDRSAAEETYDSRANVDELAERCMFSLDW